MNTLFYFCSAILGSVLIATCTDLRAHYLRKFCLAFKVLICDSGDWKSPLLHVNQAGWPMHCSHTTYHSYNSAAPSHGPKYRIATYLRCTNAPSAAPKMLHSALPKTSKYAKIDTDCGYTHQTASRSETVAASSWHRQRYSQKPRLSSTGFFYKLNRWDYSILRTMPSI